MYSFIDLFLNDAFIFVLTIIVVALCAFMAALAWDDLRGSKTPQKSPTPPKAGE